MQSPPIAIATIMLLAESFSSPRFGWDLVGDFNSMLQYPYMRHAFVAGAIVSILGAVVGWFAVLRSETYATHTLSILGFPGASGAALIGVQPLLGFFVFCVSGALAIPALAGRGNQNTEGESAAIGSVQAIALALGLLFVSLYHGFLNGVSTFLFGTFTGITFGQDVILAAVAGVTLMALATMRRRLLFASIDPHTAEASGVSVSATEVMFLVLLGVSVAEASQFTGALLAFTLTITPAAIAQSITPRPAVAMVVAVVLGLSFAWAGLAAAYFTSYPVGFFVTTLAFATYVITQFVMYTRRHS